MSMRVVLAGSRSLAERLLVSFGETIELIGFADSLDALESMTRNLQPDAIVLDWKMRQLLPQLPGPELPVVIFPSDRGETDEEPDPFGALQTAIALTSARRLAGAEAGA
jgi:CheY-like chemotaxis protein